MEPARRTKLVILTGLSGSGKSTVAKCFEDLGYYCVDNLPLPLLRELLAAPLDLVGRQRDIAVVTDVRTAGFAAQFPGIFREIDRSQVQPTLLFLEASDESLVRRFSETRRPHPLSHELSVLEAIQREREMLAELRGLADMIFDTTEWSIHETRSKVYHAFGNQSQVGPEMQVALISFGFKYGIPVGSDLLFDVRFLPNPHFVPALKPLTGCDAPIVEYLEEKPEFVELVERLSDLLLYLLPRYRSEHRSYLSVAIGCTGGRHRSVAIVEALGQRLAAAGWKVRRSHRDMERDGPRPAPAFARGDADRSGEPG
ncbi:MAG TPA: RNase adapter RapZ [Thermoanaerobaculia bacterium]|nr:RNase adapter RapZ [Thermoanaerobaculia bacterium]